MWLVDIGQRRLEKNIQVQRSGISTIRGSSSISPVLYPDLEFLDVYLHERYIPSFVRFDVIIAVLLEIKSSGMLCTLIGSIVTDVRQ